MFALYFHIKPFQILIQFIILAAYQKKVDDKCYRKTQIFKTTLKPTIKARVGSFDMYEMAPGDDQLGKNIQIQSWVPEISCVEVNIVITGMRQIGTMNWLLIFRIISSTFLVRLLELFYVCSTVLFEHSALFEYLECTVLCGYFLK